MSVKELEYVIISQTSKEVMLQFKDKERTIMHMILESDWQEFFDFLKLRWISLNPDLTLKVYGVTDKSLMPYHLTPQQNKYNIVNIPPESNRLRDQEILGQQEYEAMLSGQEPPVDQDSLDFNFEQSRKEGQTVHFNNQNLEAFAEEMESEYDDSVAGVKGMKMGIVDDMRNSVLITTTHNQKADNNT
jgi:hypothetical protein